MAWLFVLGQVEVEPDAAGMPGAELIQRLLNWSQMIALWGSLGALLVPVAVYGLVLGATAVGAARCHPLIAWGGLFFLASDSVLAFRLFMPEALPDWSSPLVMATYCLGQGLIAAGVVVSARRLRTRAVDDAAMVEKAHA